MVKESKNKIVVGLTNSSDSKAAAYLLNRQGYEVLAVTFLYSPKNSKQNGDKKIKKPEEIGHKCRVKNVKDIKNFCQKLGIQHLGFFSFDEFKDEVIDSCISFRLKTASDNPCYSCSKLTLKLLSQKASELGAEFISTGHYAKVHFSKTTKSYFLNAANDIESDQSFLLAKVKQDILCKLILPLGDLRKVEVQKISERKGWSTELRADEFGKCLSDNRFDQYINKNVANSLFKTGNIIFNNDDLSVGTHEGLHLQKFGEKFVGTLYPTTATGDYVVVNINRYNGDLFIEKKNRVFVKRIFLNDVRLRASAVLTKPKHIVIKIEGRQGVYSSVIHFKNNNSCLIILEKKINEIFPSGTHVTFYEKLLGGRLSVLGSGRVKYEVKFLEINGDKQDEEKRSEEFEF